MTGSCRIAMGLLLLAGTGCAGRHRPKEGLGEVERLPRLETVNPTWHSDKARLKVEHSYTATVESIEKADLIARVRGYVKDIRPDIDIGREIKKNEPLLTLDVPDILAERDNKKAL